MSTPVRVAAYVAALVAVFAAALGVGRWVGPVDVEPAAATHGGSPEGHAAPGSADDEDKDPDAAAAAAAHVPGGLSLSADGYTLRLADDRVTAGPRPVAFTITGPDGEPLSDYQRAHGKLLHLIAVRRDFAGYQHVHPDLTPGGVWIADLNLSPGIWRLFADFVPYDGEPLTLGTDLVVAGSSAPNPTPGVRTTDTVDGYTVSLAGDLVPGTESGIGVTVAREGAAVTDLQPYLGSRGHLVALREGDLAYLHVHPVQDAPGPRVPFVAEVPSAGRYRLFFDFRHDGVVRTASFVVATEGPGPQEHGAEEGASHDH